MSQLPLLVFDVNETLCHDRGSLASDDSSFVTGIELFVDGGTAQV